MAKATNWWTYSGARKFGCTRAFMRNTRFVQITILHKSIQGAGVNSDEQHVNSVTEALQTIRNHPFGLGPGAVYFYLR
ncbi:MAG: hypothetical protein U0491_01945 [Candidatus Saccharimonadales bacterium]